MFEKPLIGVVAGDDPYYDFLKEHIGEFHWSPAEVFALKYGQGTDPSSLRVICMIFPQTEETKICRIMRRFSHAITGWFHGENGNL